MKLKKQITHWKEIFTKCISNEGELDPEYIKLSNLINKKMKYPIKKAKDLINILLKKTWVVNKHM